MALIGYVRLSTGSQKLALQHDALNAAGCERIFDDHASGAKTDRPVLTEALAYLRAGDTLVVWKLGRLGRSMRHLIKKVGELAARGVGFRSVTEQIDTTTSGGMLVFNIFGSLAQFERDLIRERTNAGLKAARERGSVGGRRPVITPDKSRKAREHIAAGLTVREAALGSRSGRPRSIRHWRVLQAAPLRHDRGINPHNQDIRSSEPSVKRLIWPADNVLYHMY